MILLTTTSDKVQVVTGSALSTKVHSSYVDLSGSTVTPGRTNLNWSTASTQDTIGSPGASTSRNVKTMTVRNADASSSNAITIQHTDGTTVVPLFQATLLAGETVVYNETDGFTVVDANGARKLNATVGRLLKTTLVTTASANFTTGVATNSIRVRGVGGGGGGAGCSSVASAASYGGGGGAGGYADKLFAVSPNTAYAYTCGAAGTNVSGAAGGNGGDSTFIVGATTVTAKGGAGAVLATATITVGTGYAGGAGGVVGTNGDVNASGQPGGGGVMVAVTPLGISGQGGSGFFGGGGVGVSAAGAGVAGTGNGAGGGGAATGASAARAGGAATAGCWLVDEFS